MTVLNKTTSLVAPREVLAEVNTQAAEAGDHFQRSNCGSPIVKGGKWYLFLQKVLNHARWSEMQPTTAVLSEDFTI